MNTQSVSSIRLPRNILVAVDAGPLSDHAILAALEMARLLDSRIELVHAVDTFVEARGLVPDPRGPELRASELAKAKQCVVEHVGSVLGPAHGGATHAQDLLHAFAGRPARVVLDRAKEVGADLIVLGALRRHAVLDFGSTARAVLAHATCPVLVQPVPVRPIARILVPVDLSAESMLALRMSCALAVLFHARITAMYCFEMERLMAIPWDGYSTFTDMDLFRTKSLEEFERTMTTFDWLDVEHEVSFVDGRPADEILERARSADMIVMGTHGRSRFASALLGSVAYEVLRASQRPVIVVRRPSADSGA